MRDTIHWHDWSSAAVAEAATQHKPILLSLVTAWSEECAAMDEATYGRPDVIDAAERHCVAIRVDADRRPDLNERYNLGGWPTTALLTPDGHVLSGGTYLGPDELIALVTQVAHAWRDRADEIREKIDAAGRTRLQPREISGSVRRQPDRDAVPWFRAFLIDHFDPANGGFGTGPKSPHVPAMQFAVTLADEDADEALKEIVDVTLGGIDMLWDAAHGGFYRSADAPDWSRPATEKTLDDNAAVLNLLLDAAVRLGSEACRERAADLVRWAKHVLAARDNEAEGGFFNSQAAVSRAIDCAMYADRNADMIGAFIRAASLFDDPWLRDFALKSLEAVVVPGYVPGQGVSHTAGPRGPALRTAPEYVGRVLSDPAARSAVRGLLGDQIRVTSALIRTHLATGQLPYSMLAAELMQYAIRTMWDEGAACFRDRVEEEAPLWPFGLNCEAACVLDRMATMTGDAAYHDRAVTILGTLSPEYRRHGVFAAPYALAVLEVIERRAPPGLELSPVDWYLDKD